MINIYDIYIYIYDIYICDIYEIRPNLPVDSILNNLTRHPARATRAD